MHGKGFLYGKILGNLGVDVIKIKMRKIKIKIIDHCWTSNGRRNNKWKA
jgi:hypothetical protein